MSLYKQAKSRNWSVRFSIGGVKVRRSTGTTDREAAKEFEARLRADLWRQRKLGEKPRYTWQEAVERWKLEAQGRDKERDAERLKWFAQYLDDAPLAEISPALIAKCRALRTGESSPSTANRYMALLRMILRKALRRWEWIERMPEVPMVRLEKIEPRFLTKSQAAALLKELSGFPHLKAVTEFALETGLRMRNVTRLEWKHIDLRRGELIVPASRAKAGETIAIPLSKRAIAILRARRRGAHPQRVFSFKRGPKGKPLPFDDANGHEFKEAAERAGVKWLRFHDLRHTWASWHIQRGTPPHIVKKLAGWKSDAMLERYAHLSVEHLREHAEHRRGKR